MQEARVNDTGFFEEVEKAYAVSWYSAPSGSRST